MLEYILKLNDKEKYLRLDKLFNSFIQDFLHGLAKGKMITPKHFFVSIGALQHFKSKNVADIVEKLSHGVSHYRTRGIIIIKIIKRFTNIPKFCHRLLFINGILLPLDTTLKQKKNHLDLKVKQTFHTT